MKICYFCVTEMVSSILDPLIWNELSGAGASQPLHDECRFKGKKKRKKKTSPPKQTTTKQQKSITLNELPKKTPNNTPSKFKNKNPNQTKPQNIW